MIGAAVRALGAACLLLAIVAVGPPAHAAAADPAARQVEAFDSALIKMMKQGPSLGPSGRAHRLTPALEQSFDMAAMTSVAVGPGWASMSDADRAALVAAFKRYTAASYAHNFASYSGENFAVDPNVIARGPDRIVQTTLTPAHGDPVSLAYRMRATTGSWKVIDVLYQGTISQLSAHRSDFAAAVASGGAKALVAHLDALTDRMMK